MNKTIKKKIIIASIMAIICTIITCIPIFATSNFDYAKIVPDDLGTKITNFSDTIMNEDITKLYAKITLKHYYSTNLCQFTTTFNILLNNGNVGGGTQITYAIGSNNDNFYITYPNITNQRYTMIIGMTIGNSGSVQSEDTTLYIPIYIRNAVITQNYEYNNSGKWIDVEYYTSTVTSQEAIQEAFNLGYTNGYTQGTEDGYTYGYNIGMQDGQGLRQYTNLVGYVEQLIGQFTGDEVARYITPLAVVLVILFVYFLFIRFLLSMIKAKGVIKTCDIIMIVGCIIILVVMYAPMLNLTIRTENVSNTDTTYEIAQDTEVVRSSNIRYWDVDEGNKIIHYGPVGTWIEYKETITPIEREEIYKIDTDVNVKEYVTREQNN